MSTHTDDSDAEGPAVPDREAASRRELAPAFPAGPVLGILNPAAGSAGEGEWLRERLSSIPGTTFRVTEGPGDGQRFAREAMEGGVRTLVAAGGDGTLHEVLNGIAPEFDRCTLGIVPMGTGNDTARSLGIPLDPAEAFERLVQHAAAPVDIMILEHDGETTYALNAATGGMGGQVNEYMPPDMKDRWGALAYARAAASALPDLPVYDLTLEIDGIDRCELSIVSLVVANGEFAARGVCVAPGARVSDGQLSVHAILESSLPELLGLIPPILRRDVPEQDNYLTWRCSELLVEASENLSVSVDGELLEAQRIRYRILPGALNILGATPAGLS